MWNRLRWLIKYLWDGKTRYLIHSPFIYNLIKHLIVDKRHYYAFDDIAAAVKQLKNNTTQVPINQLGAGSQVHRASQQTISSLVRNTGIPAKYGRLLFRLINHYQLKNIVELGTGTGVSTLYMAAACKQGKLISLEGNTPLAQVAQNQLDALGYKHATVVSGPFDETLQTALQSLGKVDLAFLDGNHQKEPTLQYFNQLLPHLQNHSVVVLDDINWSAEMTDTWETLKQHPQVHLSINLYRMGILFMNNDFRQPQHIALYY